MTAVALESRRVQGLHRHWPRVLAAVIRFTGNIDLSEAAAEDAFQKARTEWPRVGVPREPVTRLINVARRLAIHRLRRDLMFVSKLPLLIGANGDSHSQRGATIPDDRRALLFMCCHPALALEARTALTLRLVAGLSVAEIARVQMTPEATISARLARAKRKLRAAGIPFRTPADAELFERLQPVLVAIDPAFLEPALSPESGAAEPIPPKTALPHLSNARLLSLIRTRTVQCTQ